MKSLLILGLVLLFCSFANAETLPEIFPLERVQPGQIGYGLTVFSGFNVERFKAEVISVMPNFLPKQDIILMRVDHPILRKTGVVAGMSGSPIFIEGKLVGAISYGWAFAKEPVCGVTPILSMLDLLKIKPRGKNKADYAYTKPSLAEQLLIAKNSTLVSKQSATYKTENTQPTLTQLTIPLDAAGFSSEAFSVLQNTFSGFGFEPVQGGGTGKVEGPQKLVTGGAIGVQMVSGDISLSGTGTVTWAGNKKAIAFGHPMFNAGEIYLPITTTRIHHTLASVMRSRKISSPARVIGTLVQDRLSGIMVDMTQRTETVPMTITLRQDNNKQLFQVQLARHRLLTASLAAAVLTSAISKVMADAARITFTSTLKLKIKGYSPFKMIEQFYTPTGIKLMNLSFSKSMLSINKILNNDFEPTDIERIEFDIDARYGADVVEITEIQMSRATVEPGARVNLIVTFRPFGQKEFSKAYPLEIPESMGDSLLLVEVAGGSFATPDLAPPENMKQFLKYLQADYPAQSLVISLHTPTQGVSLQGHVIKDLPDSVLDSLNTGAKTASQKPYKTVWNKVFNTQRLVFGKKDLRIRVKSNP